MPSSILRTSAALILLSLLPAFGQEQSHYDTKFKIEGRITNFDTHFTLKSGMGFYFYRKNEVWGASHQYTNYINLSKPIYDFTFDFGIRMKNLFLYQGGYVSINIFPDDDGNVSTSYKNTNQWFSTFEKRDGKRTELNSKILQFGYSVTYRHYNIVRPRWSGWYYRYFYFGGAPNIFLFFVNNKQRITGPNGVGLEPATTERIISAKFGLEFFLGLKMSFARSPLTFGMEMRITDIFAPPSEKIDPEDKYKFFDKFRYHQTMFKLGFALGLNI